MKLQLLLTALFGFTCSTVIKVDVWTEGFYSYSGTGDNIDITLFGSVNDVSFRLGSDFPKSSMRSVEYDTGTKNDLGKVHCIELDTDGEDWWWPRTVSVTLDGGEPINFYNTFSQKLSNNDKDSGPLIWMCNQGDETCTVEADTATNAHANSNGIVMMATIYGKTGATLTGIFDNRDKDDFEKGNVDTFEFTQMKKVGAIRCIALRVLVGLDAWLFNTMTVTCGKQTKTFQNEDQVWLSNDPEDSGVVFLKLC